MTIIKWRTFLVPFWILFLVSTAESATNEADLYYTCDEFGLHLKMNFDHPFRGLVYIKGYPKDPNCRLSLPRSTSEASFNVPLMACDTVVRLRPDTNPWMKGFLVFQQHPLISTVVDFTEPFMCVVHKNTTASWTEVLRKAYNALNDSPNVDSWLDFELLPGLMSEEQESNIKLGSSYIFLYVNGAGKFNDMFVTDCIAHREPFLLRNSSILQMTRPNGCSNASTNMLSQFDIMRNDRDLIVGAYSEINPVQIPSLENGFVSCSAVLCKRKCKCTKNSSPNGYGLVFTRKFPSSRSKRSITESPSNINETRRIFMKSTVKALTERLMKYRRQSKLLKNDTDFVKRSSLSEKETIDDDYTTIGLYPTEQFLSTEFTTELSEDFGVQNLNTKSLSVNISTTIIPEEEVEKIFTNLVMHATTMKSNVTFKDPFLGNYSITLIPEIEFERKFNLVEQSTIETSSSFDKTVKVSEEPVQKLKDIFTTNITTERKEQTGNDTTKVEESHSDPSCISKLKFVVVTSVLSFVIFCLILISCGLTLYLKKERKKHIIDSYLLYNFY